MLRYNIRMRRSRGIGRAIERDRERIREVSRKSERYHSVPFGNWRFGVAVWWERGYTEGEGQGGYGEGGRRREIARLMENIRARMLSGCSKLHMVLCICLELQVQAATRRVTASQLCCVLLGI